MTPIPSASDAICLRSFLWNPLIVYLDSIFMFQWISERIFAQPRILSVNGIFIRSNPNIRIFGVEYSIRRTIRLHIFVESNPCFVFRIFGHSTMMNGPHLRYLQPFPFISICATRTSESLAHEASLANYAK